LLFLTVAFAFAFLHPEKNA